MWLDTWLLVGGWDEPVSVSASESECGLVEANADALRGQERVAESLMLGLKAVVSHLGLVWELNPSPPQRQHLLFPADSFLLPLDSQ